MKRIIVAFGFLLIVSISYAACTSGTPCTCVTVAGRDGLGSDTAEWTALSGGTCTAGVSALNGAAADFTDFIIDSQFVNIDAATIGTSGNGRGTIRIGGKLTGNVASVAPSLTVTAAECTDSTHCDFTVANGGPGTVTGSVNPGDVFAVSGLTNAAISLLNGIWTVGTATTTTIGIVSNPYTAQERPISNIACSSSTCTLTYFGGTLVGFAVTTEQVILSGFTGTQSGLNGTWNLNAAPGTSTFVISSNPLGTVTSTPSTCTGSNPNACQANFAGVIPNTTGAAGAMKFASALQNSRVLTNANCGASTCTVTASGLSMTNLTAQKEQVVISGITGTAAGLNGTWLLNAAASVNTFITSTSPGTFNVALTCSPECRAEFHPIFVDGSNNLSISMNNSSPGFVAGNHVITNTLVNASWLNNVPLTITSSDGTTTGQTIHAVIPPGHANYGAVELNSSLMGTGLVSSYGCVNTYDGTNVGACNDNPSSVTIVDRVNSTANNNPTGSGTANNPGLDATTKGVFVGNGIFKINGTSTHTYTMSSADGGLHQVYIHHKSGDAAGVSATNGTTTYTAYSTNLQGGQLVCKWCIISKLGTTVASFEGLTNSLMGGLVLGSSGGNQAIQSSTPLDKIDVEHNHLTTPCNIQSSVSTGTDFRVSDTTFDNGVCLHTVVVTTIPNTVNATNYVVTGNTENNNSVANGDFLKLNGSVFVSGLTFTDNAQFAAVAPVRALFGNGNGPTPCSSPNVFARNVSIAPDNGGVTSGGNFAYTAFGGDCGSSLSYMILRGGIQGISYLVIGGATTVTLDHIITFQPWASNNVNQGPIITNGVNERQSSKTTLAKSFILQVEEDCQATGTGFTPLDYNSRVTHTTDPGTLGFIVGEDNATDYGYCSNPSAQGQGGMLKGDNDGSQLYQSWVRNSIVSVNGTTSQASAYGDKAGTATPQSYDTTKSAGTIAAGVNYNVSFTPANYPTCTFSTLACGQYNHNFANFSTGFCTGTNCDGSFAHAHPSGPILSADAISRGSTVTPCDNLPNHYCDLDFQGQMNVRWHNPGAKASTNMSPETDAFAQQCGAGVNSADVITDLAKRWNLTNNPACSIMNWWYWISNNYAPLGNTEDLVLYHSGTPVPSNPDGATVRPNRGAVQVAPPHAIASPVIM